jgi:hypothetical protein
VPRSWREIACASWAGWRRARFLQHIVKPVLVQGGLHACDDGLDGLVIGAVAGFAHAHDRFCSGQKALDERSLDRLGSGIDHLEGHRLEVLPQLRLCRHALQREPLQRCQIDARSGELARLCKLGRVGVSAVDRPLQVGELERQHDALRGGLAVAFALHDALNILLQGRELAGDWRHCRCHVVWLAKAASRPSNRP